MKPSARALALASAALLAASCLDTALPPTPGPGTVSLEALKPGPGRDLSLGEVLLGKHARVAGQVRAVAEALEPSGHAGTTVLVKGTSFLTFSADDGSYQLPALPEGRLELLFFREGFDPAVIPLELTSGEERQLERVLLSPSVDPRAAQVTGRVLGGEGPLAGARVQVVGAAAREDVTSDGEGAWATGNLPPGVYNLGVEASGHLPALLEGVLLVAGPQTLSDVVLTRGDAQALMVQPPPGLGTDGGLDCAGACASGFTCSARIACETPACELVSCPGACVRGRCFANGCPQQACAAGEVCDGARCVPLACAGLTCPATTACAAGRCVPTLCTNGPCPAGLLCAGGRCVDARCVDLDCGAGRSCVAGQCFPAGAGGVSCAPGAVVVSGRCTDLRCEGVTCAPGSFCQAGTCTASGLFAAGTVLASGNGAAETLVLASGPSGWRRVNLTALPRVVQLLISRDGQWLFAHTDDATGGNEEGSVWRSADGETWLRTWAGDAANSGIVTALAIDHPSGRLVASLAGGPNGLASSVIVSADDGATWSTAWRSPLINGVIRDRITGVSPGYAVISFSNFSASGIYPLDGGARFPWYSASDTLLLSDPAGAGEAYVAGDQLYSLDGGLLGPMRAACQGCVLYAEGPARTVHVTASTAVWFASDGLGPWGQRATPTLSGPSFRGLARGADGVLYLGNEGGAGPSLLASSDDGVTFNSVSDDWRSTPELSDPYPPWTPDASFPFNTRVRPTVPSGFAYACAGGTCQSGELEPAWKTDGGQTPDRVGNWNLVGPVAGVRVSALVSRACSVGQQRCGSACVSVVSDPSHCGACGVTCAGACVLGRCAGSADAGTASGCADGTREGFLDEAAWPDLAACQGAWPGELTAPEADLVCGAGFHVCTAQDTELRAVTGDDAVAFAGCFAYRASNDGFDGCEPLECVGNPHRDDMAGLGRSCRLLSGVFHRGDGGAGSCLADGTRVDARCCAASLTGQGCRQTSQSGVVCCRD